MAVATAFRFRNGLPLPNGSSAIPVTTFNPWVTLYQAKMDFVSHWDFKSDVYVIDIRLPRMESRPTTTMIDANMKFKRPSRTSLWSITHKDKACIGN